LKHYTAEPRMAADNVQELRFAGIVLAVGKRTQLGSFARP